MAEFETVLHTPELGPGALREVRVHGRSVVVANVHQTYYALDATCPVDGTNLGRGGRLQGEVLVCTGDDARFDVRNGARIGGGDGLRALGIRVEGNEVRVGPPLD